MKAFAFSSGAFSVSISIIGMLFKIMHWPGANILLVVGLGIFALLFIPLIAKYAYSRAK